MRTTKAQAATAEVSSGKAFKTTERMAAAKIANSRQASRVRPAGTGMNQRPQKRSRTTASLTILTLSTVATFISDLLQWWEIARRPG
ncbi:MAG: hypothetical protein AW07_03967 [Candidatus Accumulibacter sp. SK-11]|nr:MAG: hypothetical protein AW07_03967 [Candidatus Accumulibacter sp. SK-11]